MNGIGEAQIHICRDVSRTVVCFFSFISDDNPRHDSFQLLLRQSRKYHQLINSLDLWLN